jgi:hypothetical protein
MIWSKRERATYRKMFTWPNYFLREGRLVNDEGEPVRTLSRIRPGSPRIVPKFKSIAEARTWLENNNIAGDVVREWEE